MAVSKTRSNPNLESIFRAAIKTFLIYFAINVIAVGWAFLTYEFGDSFSFQLKFLSLRIDDHVIGLSWDNSTTRVLLIAVFLAFIANDLLRGKARLSPPTGK